MIWTSLQVTTRMKPIGGVGGVSGSVSNPTHKEAGGGDLCSAENTSHNPVVICLCGSIQLAMFSYYHSKYNFRNE